ncbi:type II toxin-antitoxin system mRNA interferase toxin, RelE/StbE family [Candidatus Shapirobacteria bacterium CG08_land_8_20_14_0_20_39_18]|uniref:Type II toxin-antitoxin system mRNA interferase toxin, RelE/StbE family n=1 Tax=Candidatus Shapirobacteria bacterium CG08_land_8_20_14_0_20_39_18 TaxID=1974883 RepID=A0A2M6XDJ4_9BACT|nr:MAG: type II toxin-antitoxin system mRNA interferase toxin, RelE/StbE family [Candidatus Shapirobacteria bacterium CG08_land_8_20_14_0_20_39_18]PIY65152.1 MAG: type II toxin-antitoxin system mRNA interferase toxin, RelE/StbE family [Candidatus Shapirobacteria bacterium CG_4_10_14_0_8_um_filter_39_15]PJE68008.1 MAG: type II toxin-antitoxin system mRNA interferase toxin, RelE/StbE family [Candidatus Shapirobacteria bacterium CG10_big_fil_rev_8_21_14_0_10_38_8]
MPEKYSYVASRKFVKSWSKFDFILKKETVNKIDIFLKNPHTPSLKTHKLSGKMENLWSFSINHSVRILFRFCQEDIVEFIDIGGHEIYK